MGLFDKKYCCHCGNKIGMLGNRKLEDGNLCKDCANLLSPWFSERRHSTVDEIQEQLKYREANQNAVARFNVTHSYGEYKKLLLDDNAKRFTITSASNLVKANPDILDYSQIVNYRTEIKESRYEIKQNNPDGADISYDPPRYKAEYDFYVTINVNNPYFDEMHFQLNNSTVYVDPTLIPIQQETVVINNNFGAPAPSMGQPVRPGMAPQPVRPGMAPQPARPGMAPQPARPGMAPQPARPGMAPQPARPGMAPQPARPGMAPQPAVPAAQPVQYRAVKTDPMTDTNYVRYYNMIQEINMILGNITSQGHEIAMSAEPGVESAVAVTCPYCGGTMIPENNCCIYCGKKVC